MGSYTVGLVGESNYQPAIEASREGERVDLLPEPTNRYDSRAILALTEYGQHIGYLPRGGWLTGVILDERKEVSATIRALNCREDGHGDIGVVLDVTIG